MKSFLRVWHAGDPGAARNREQAGDRGEDEGEQGSGSGGLWQQAVHYTLNGKAQSKGWPLQCKGEEAEDQEGRTVDSQAEGNIERDLKTYFADIALQINETTGLWPVTNVSPNCW